MSKGFSCCQARAAITENLIVASLHGGTFKEVDLVYNDLSAGDKAIYDAYLSLMDAANFGFCVVGNAPQADNLTTDIYCGAEAAQTGDFNELDYDNLSAANKAKYDNFHAMVVAV